MESSANRGGSVLLLWPQGPIPDNLAAALFSGQFQVTRITHPDELSEHFGNGTQFHAVVSTDAAIYNGSRVAMLKFLETLREWHTCSLILSQNTSAPRPSWAEGPMVCWAHLRTVADEIYGRVAAMTHHHPIIEQLHARMAEVGKKDRELQVHFGYVDEEMRLASRIQRDFLPQEMPTVGDVRFAVIFRPATWVSGDIYDVFQLDEDNIGFYVADVVGHGMPAALLTLFVKRSLQTKWIKSDSYEIVAPGESLKLLNQDILDQNLSNAQFLTACYGVLNVNTRQFRYARAGHPMPLRIRPDGSFSELDADGAILGIIPDEDYETVTVELEPGEKIMMLSDGVELAFHGSDGDMERIYRDHLAGCMARPVEQLISKLESHLDDQPGSLNPRDDVTFVVAEIKDN